jgi:hypothetical protein
MKSFERIARLQGKGRFLVSLVFAEHNDRPCVEIDIAPADPAASLVVRIAKDFGASDA